jgi:hypothetical protein
MWPFSLSSFKSSPMLSMLLSVEELESLVIPYCHVFENHLHFLAFVNSVVLQLLLIIIKPWFLSFVISSSLTSITSLSLLHLPQIFFYFHNRTCTETPLQVEVHESIFPMRHHTHVPNKRVVPILLWRCNLSKESFCHISLYGSSKLMILDALERWFDGASEN